MNLLVTAALAVIALTVIGKILTRVRGSAEGETLPYFKKKTLLNEKEQVLFHRLIEAMPNCYVMAQVRLADIVGIKKSPNWQALFNKVSRKSVDFVICNKSFEVLACVELDGKTHELAERIKADNDKDAALKAAGIPILRIEARNMDSIGELKLKLEKALLH